VLCHASRGQKWRGSARDCIARRRARDNATAIRRRYASGAGGGKWRALALRSPLTPLQLRPPSPARPRQRAAEASAEARRERLRSEAEPETRQRGQRLIGSILGQLTKFREQSKQPSEAVCVRACVRLSTSC